MIPHIQKAGWFLFKKSLALFHEVLLDLLQPVQAVVDLQVNLRPLEMVPNDYPYPKIWGLKKKQVSSMLGSQVTSQSSP